MATDNRDRTPAARYGYTLRKTSPMNRARKVTGLAARGVVLAAAFAAAAAPPYALAQAPAAQAPAASAAPAVRPAAPPAGLSESVAAVVNDQIISTYDLAQRMRLLIATSGIQPTQENIPQFQREALISLVDERLQIQELRRQEKDQKISIIASDEELNEEIADMAKSNNLSAEQFIASLQSQGIGIVTLKEQIRAQISWQRWIRGRYGSRLRVGEDQVKAVQQRMEAAASKPQYQISEVFLDANRVGGMETAMTGAAQLVNQMQQGAPFPAVARQFSAAATAAHGGDAGWITAGEMAPEIDAALEQMRPGQLSQPIQVRDGVYIIYLREKRAGGSATLVSLKQAAVALPQNATEGQIAAATATLETLRGQVTGCGDLEAKASTVNGVVAGDLGEAEIKDLAPAFRQAVETLGPGQLSQPIRTNAGLHILAVCSKRGAGGEQVTAEQIESRLFGQQLSMIARRYMRDLRNSATIETR
ncbi:peptidylprolyl isomerase [Phenylobacterium sp.]|uniref:peptidylprolyl isomerase n=1 Tax=Phenylobacterium sp. TaxID=1871053 RepID=UPI0027316C64|nr:peptidylprolyl isomerase [Phenylobacterium sp.]MDP1600088.1 peptidylprolyl isomerase [Phenylobacterium sp.]